MNKKNSLQYKNIVFVILLLSLILRAILVFSGGQYFFPDESRYHTSIIAANALWAGDFLSFFKALHSADHFLFKVIGVLPAILQIIFGTSPKIPALFFSLFSVVNLWLTWKIMLRLGESKRVALWGISLLALCSTFLYYSRHLLPFDISMTFGLLAVLAAIRRPALKIDSVLTGIFSALCFLTYNGYWTLAGFAIVAHILYAPDTLLNAAKRGLITISFFSMPIISLLAISAAAGGELLKDFTRFSSTVSQGEFAEGWILPIAYFWHSEHLISLLWIAALLFGVSELAKKRKNYSIGFAVFGIAFIYGVLVFFSVYLQKFVVYGRLARQMVPFLSILTASLMDKLWASQDKKKKIFIIVFSVVLFQAAFNFSKPLTQMFPLDFLQLASKTSSQVFPIESVELWGSNAITLETENYEILFAHYIYPTPEPVMISGKVILQRQHPQLFLPFQYEGYTQEQRNAFRSTNISMRLVLKEKP